MNVLHYNILYSWITLLPLWMEDCFELIEINITKHNLKEKHESVFYGRRDVLLRWTLLLSWSFPDLLRRASNCPLGARSGVSITSGYFDRSFSSPMRWKMFLLELVPVYSRYLLCNPRCIVLLFCKFLWKFVAQNCVLCCLYFKSSRLLFSLLNPFCRIRF